MAAPPGAGAEEGAGAGQTAGGAEMGSGAATTPAQSSGLLKICGEDKQVNPCVGTELVEWTWTKCTSREGYELSRSCGVMSDVNEQLR